jgi:galacturan 1,4-alpha-galacturonidase
MRTLWLIIIVMFCAKYSLLACLAVLSVVSGPCMGMRTTCTVASSNNLTASDVPAINAALNTCGSGGTVVLLEGVTYAISEVLDINACRGCTIEIEGECPSSRKKRFRVAYD